MSDPLTPDPVIPAPATAATHDDKILPLAIYVLFLIGLLNGLTILIGLVMAYVLKEGAGPTALSHYTFQIRTVWIGLAAAVLGAIACAVLFVISLPLTLIGIGFALWGVIWLYYPLLGLWFVLRCAVGLARIARDQPYPRPRAWIA